MANGDRSYLKRRGEVWWLKLAIPRELRATYPSKDRKGNRTGKLRTHVEESLHTGDLTEANRKKHARLAVHLAEFKRRQEASAAVSSSDRELAHAYALRDQLNGEPLDEHSRDLVIEQAEALFPGARAGEHDSPDPTQLAKAQRFVKVAEGRMTLRDAFGAQCKDLQRRASSDEKYEQALDMLHAFMEHKELFPEDVSPEDALRFVDYLNHSARSKRGGPLAFQTKKNLVSGLSSLWNYLEHRRQVPRGSNPWRNHLITGKRKPHEAPRETDKRPWPDEAIIKLCNGPEVRNSRQTVCTKRTIMEVFALAFYTGATVDEICSRTVGQISKTAEGYALKIEHGKRSSRIRTLPVVNPIPVAILKRRSAGRSQQSDSPLFPEFREGGYDKKRGKTAVKALWGYRRKVGITGALDSHGARRTLLSLLEQRGAHPVWAQRYAGHKPMDMTHGLYAKGAESSLLGVARLVRYPDKVERAFKGALGLT
jgi:integrase